MTIKNTIFILAILLATCLQTFGQHLGLTFQEAQKQGIITQHFDSIYKSALHADTTLAVFKTNEEQKAMQQEYIMLLQSIGKFLSANDFEWDKPTKCFHKIYFNSDGTIDYFLYNFTGKIDDRPSEEKQKEFERLLNLFIKDYKISLTANTKFAQCGPATYQPKQ